MSVTDLWKNTFGLMVSRPARYQVAALCWRDGPSGPEILLVTSRDTGRWVLPKGSPKRGRKGSEMAAEEAWEEAGVIPADRPARDIGAYRYDKRLEGGLTERTEVEVFAFEVAALAEAFPEAHERRREWMTPAAAAASVDEPDLAALLRGFVRPGGDAA
ncbi:NUDIX hydrolase [Rhodovulum sp. DZ06]|uniref:NUDIX hydrolase n=1 Tax=Rhodovulum sp. DZ06 TaxID=3425126 RepID=UPI003D340A1C